MISEQEPTVPQSLTFENLYAKIEALLFASPRPLGVNDILEILEGETASFKEIKIIIQKIGEFHSARSEGGFLLESVGAGLYQFRTRAELTPVVERLYSRRPRPFSRAAQETLAIIAYRQPVSRSDFEFIRGTDSGSIIKNLLERDLIRCSGRKKIPGKPMLFVTTEEFLRVYRLNNLDELPPLESFQPRRELLDFVSDLENTKEEGEEAPAEAPLI